MRKFMLALTAIMMGTLFTQNAARADAATPNDRAVSTVAQEFVHEATYYKKRYRYRRHDYGYDRHDRYERRHYRNRYQRDKLRRFKRFLRHEFRGRDYRRYDRHWN